jgi:hypothetical protein
MKEKPNLPKKRRRIFLFQKKNGKKELYKPYIGDKV